MIKMILDNKFLAITKRLGNSTWAVEELEYLIYVKHKTLYDKIGEEYKKDIDDYMFALKQLHGGC